MNELVPAALAAILLAGMIAIVLVELFLGKPVTIPDVLSMAAVSIVSFFFGTRTPTPPTTPTTPGK